MSWRFYLLFFLLGLAPLLAVAAFQNSPGYMDADYYFAGGLRLAQGHGFSEIILWNYLGDPTSLPHPSHGYWMPLVSILSALGIMLAGDAQFASARWVLLPLAAMIPPLTGALAWALHKRKSAATLAASLACLPAFYLPFLPVTDAFGITMLLGCAFFLVISSPAVLANASPRSVLLKSFLLGLLAGLMHLSRAEGALWLLISTLAVLSFCLEDRRKPVFFRQALLAILFCLSGYALVMAPWIARNLTVFGALLAPGGSRALWITQYDELFIYPASLLTLERWWNTGFATIIQARFWAAGQNLQSALAVQGLVFLSPLILVGMWRLRRDRRVRFAVIAWLFIFFVMTAIFPFQGARGGFFHSGAALQPFFWAIVPAGLEAFVGWGAQRRNWKPPQARLVFSIGCCVLALILSSLVAYGKLKPTDASRSIWDQGYVRYLYLENELRNRGAVPGEVVLVNNSPGYFIASDRPAISIPFGDLQTACSVAERYRGRYLLLEIDQIRGESQLFLHPSDRHCLRYLDTIAGVKVFEIRDP